MPRLRRSDCAGAGIRRRRRGRGFSYQHDDGTPVREPAVLDRLRSLAVPPAWTDVWICPFDNGHVQAVGTDDAGRRQYLYHQLWRERQDAIKHQRATELAEELPAARRRVSADLRRPKPDRRRTLAAAFRLLDLGSFRIGSESYASAHNTFGVATLHRDHVETDGQQIFLEFPGKGAKPVERALADRELVRALKPLVERDDAQPELLAWRDDEGQWHDVRSEDVNEYVRRVTGGDFTAKDFRTWNATVLMAVELARSDQAFTTSSSRRRFVAQCVRTVAEHLNNTPAVARRSYIDPRVIDLFQDGVVLDVGALDGRPDPDTVHGVAARSYEQAEAMTLELLRHPRRRERDR